MSPFANVDKPTITEEYKFTFGQYRGYTVEEVLEFDAPYIRWCAENIPWFDLDVSLDDRVTEREYEHNPYPDEQDFLDD